MDRDLDLVRSLIQAQEVVPTDVNEQGTSVFFVSVLLSVEELTSTVSDGLQHGKHSLLDMNNTPILKYLLPLIGRWQLNNRESDFSGE